MAKKKNQKRSHSRAVELKRQAGQEKLAGEKDRAKNRWNPAGRALLYGDLVFLALSLLLESMEVISREAVGLCSILGIVLLLIALWLLFGPQADGKRAGKGPRL